MDDSWIYFDNTPTTKTYSTGNLWKMKKDGTELQIVSDEEVIIDAGFSMAGDWIYAENPQGERIRINKTRTSSSVKAGDVISFGKYVPIQR